MLDPDNCLFMLPGPVKLHPRVLRAMAHPAINHRSPEFREIVLELRDLLQYTFRTKAEVALISGSGTAGMESAISSLCGRKESVLCVSNGKFGERLFDLARVYADAELLKFPWGKTIDIDKVAEALDKKRYKAVTFCHNETSTGMANPPGEIVKTVKKTGAFVILDGISSIGGLEMDMDVLGADICVFGSQKCVAGPAGTAGIAVSKAAQEAMHDGGNYYLNLRHHIQKMREGDTPWTPAIPVFFGLREALRMLKEEGLENRINRCKALGEACRNAAKAVGLGIFPEESYSSSTLTAIKYPPGIDDLTFRGALKERHSLIIAGAHDQLKGKVFRIGHMGICTWTDMAATWTAIEAEFNRAGHTVKPGAAVSCITERM